MKLTRRQLLKSGGAMLVAVVGGGVFRATDQGVFSAGEGIAYEPWTAWRNGATAAERIVAAAILASNPHNSQPWMFRVGERQIDLLAVPERQIGVIDPFRREMTIGLGCAVENMRLAALAEGFRPDIRLMPDPADPLHMATVSLQDGAGAMSSAESAMHEAIPQRHTNRAAYDAERSLANEALAALRGLVVEPSVRLFWMDGEASRRKFGEVAVAAAEALVSDEQQSKDSHLWWRKDWNDVQRHADGITLDAQALPPAVGILAKMLPDMSRAANDRIFVGNVRDVMASTASALGILAVRDGRDARQRLQCGQAWQRMHLWATTQGIAMQPLNQMTERADREVQLGIEPHFGRAVAELIADADWHGIMPLRAGYPLRPALPSPRRGLDRVLVG